MCSARSCARPPAVATACAGRRRTRLALAGLLLCVANDAEGKAIRSPRAAFETGEPALLSADTTKDWLGWQGAAALGFFAQNQQGMGLKALAKEYKGKLPIGGVRPTDTAVQQAFGVKPTDLPVILVLQRGTVSMRLGGNSNHATLKTLINSALSSAGPPPPPPPPPPVRTSAAELRTECAQIRGPCLVLVGDGLEADAFAETLSKQKVVRGDAKDHRLTEALGYTHAMGPVLYVLKGNSRPRVARHTGKAGDRAALTAFFTQLKEGSLQFEAFQWPSVVKAPEGEPDGGAGSGSGGGGGGKGRDSSPPPPQAELTNGQYNAQDSEEVEEIVLEDDDE